MAPAPEPSSGSFDGALHRFSLRVYYEDTDLTGAVYHANYLRWFERARSDMLRLLSIDQRSAFETGEGSYAVAGMSIRYLAPARLDDAVLIETRAEEAGAATCRLRQRAMRPGALLAEALVRVAFVGINGRPRRQPEPWRRAFASLISGPEG
jgi:acyl-CoA thioester hydrolase